MTIFEKTTENIPDYSPTMFMYGYTPEEILIAKRMQMVQELQEEKNIELPSDVHITTEVIIK